MSVFGKPLAVALGVAALSGANLVPLAYALVSSTPAEAQEFTAEPAPVAAPAILPAPDSAPAPAFAEEPEPSPPADTLVDAELTCLAKVVVHEAGNQSRTGQLAVAQVVMNRLNDSRGRFASTICGVVMQRGQFFNVHAYNPPRNARWRTALEVSREARAGTAAPVIGNALFFHAAHAGPFRGRTRVGRIGGHIFYR